MTSITPLRPVGRCKGENYAITNKSADNMYSHLKTLLIIFLVCLCSYFNIFKDPFQFDGVRYIKENPYIIGLVEKNII